MNAISFSFDALRAAVLLGVALAIGVAMRRSSAVTRRSVLVAGMVAVLVAPFAARLLAESRASTVVDWPLLSFVPAAEPVGVEGAATVPSAELRAPAPPRGARVVATRPSHANWANAIFAVWILGAAIVMARLGYGVFGAQLLARRARRDETAPFAEVIARVLGEANVRAEVALSDDVPTPAVAGLFRPVVLMPRAALGWSESRWRVVLLHELAHVRGRDCMVGVVAELVCAMHWFDPLAWLTPRICST
jgi:beta-lactamase regulating signal transducer with metallopeptidase domain